jgi:hypothetical protein
MEDRVAEEVLEAPEQAEAAKADRLLQSSIATSVMIKKHSSRRSK